jgi:hypothetical protein
MEIRRKDKHLSQAIELLDIRFEEAGGDPAIAYSNLTDFETKFVDKEILSCATNFRYYAENYHTINSKHDGIKSLYPFFDSQEIFYEKIREIQLQGKPVQVLVLKARQLGLCLDPKTKVLTSDLRWIAIEDVRVGQHLVSVDENVPGGKGHARKMRTATAVASREVFECAFRVTVDNGEQFIATGPHRFLCKIRGGPDTRWRAVCDMRIGDQIRSITRPWGTSSYEDGWFAGMLDGEGSFRSKKGGAEASVAQALGNVYDKAREYLELRGYTFREDLDERQPGESSKFGTKVIGKLVLSRMDELFRLIGQTRPFRFIGKEWWEGKELPGKGSGTGWSKIVSIEALPVQRMIDLQTTTKTFIAEGFVSHNSTINEALILHKTIFNEGCNTLIVAQDPGQADYLFDMSRLAYECLPWWMRPESRYEAKGRYLHFDRRDELLRKMRPGLRSAIYVEAANKLSGVAVGKALVGCHMSELSLWPEAKVLAEQIFPTLSGTPDQIAVLESTARGRNNFWYDLWVDAMKGKVPWTPIFIEFFRLKKYSMPIPTSEKFEKTSEEVKMCEKIKETANFVLSDEQVYWRRQKIQEFATLNRGDESKFYQEFPSSSWQESFQGSGICAFNKRALQMIRETTSAPPRFYGEIDLTQSSSGNWDVPRIRLTQVKKRPDGSIPLIPPAENPGSRLYVWEEPIPGAIYNIAADVAHGVYGGDYSCAQIIRLGSGPSPDVQVAEWHGWINPTPYGDVLAALGYWYNTAQLCIECNDVGLATNNQVMLFREYPNLFRWKNYDKIKHRFTDFLGWYTNVKTRDQIIAKFREFIDDRMITLRSEELLDECLDFSSVDDGRFEGQSTHDDRVFAMMIAIFCAHDLPDTESSFSSSRPQIHMEDNVCICGHTKENHGDGRAMANCQSCKCPIWRQKIDFANTEYSPTFDGGRQHLSHPNEDDVPGDVSMWDSVTVADNEKWKTY